MVTCQGPVNIAVIKYCMWERENDIFKSSCDQELQLRTFIFLQGGKRDEQRILPLNSSLSVTLDKKEVIDFFTPAVTSSSTWENRGSGSKISDSHEISNVLR